MTPLDIILLTLIVGFVLAGFFKGLVQSLGSIVGLLIGAIAAGRFYPGVAKAFLPVVNGNETAAAIAGFAVTFAAFSQLTGLVFTTLNSMMKFITLIPGIGFLNRLLGALLGLIEGVLFLGLVLAFASRLPLSEFGINVLAGSIVTPGLVKVGGWLILLLPSAIRKAQSVIGS